MNNENVNQPRNSKSVNELTSSQDKGSAHKDDISKSENQANQLQTTFLNVADFRDEIDHLFRVVNCDYHSCVGLNEYKYFHEILKRVFDQVALVACKRAKPRDTSRFEGAIQAGISCYHKSLERIERLEGLKTGVCSRVA